MVAAAAVMVAAVVAVVVAERASTRLVVDVAADGVLLGLQLDQLRRLALVVERGRLEVVVRARLHYHLRLFALRIYRASEQQARE